MSGSFRRLGLSMPPETQALKLLQQARTRVAHGHPSPSLAGTTRPWVPTQSEAKAESIAAAFVNEAREMWGKAPAHVPPASSALPDCGRELRQPLADAIRCAELKLAWEDAGGLSRPQALCVVHLAICLAMWRLREAQAELAAHQERERWKRDGETRAAAVAPLIWGPTPAKPKPEERATVPASFRELASVSSAFADWGPEVASDDELCDTEGEGTR